MRIALHNRVVFWIAIAAVIAVGLLGAGWFLVAVHADQATLEPIKKAEDREDGWF
jgi:hypothetical protein